MTSNYSIYCLKKNNDLVEVATVNHSHDIKSYTHENDKIDINCKSLPHSIQHMDEYFKELYHLMILLDVDVKQNIISTKKYFFENNEFVKATIINRSYMRKGSYYYVVQESDRGIRFLLYAINRIHHSSVSLGWSMRLPDANTEMIEMKKILHEYNKKESTILVVKLDEATISNNTLFFL